MATPRVDTLVANAAAAVASLHECVLESAEFVLEPVQMVELMQAAARLNTLLYLEMGEPDSGPDGREGKLPSPPSLVPSEPSADPSF
jgi:hypothetical protein